jgi:hypothetical protein
MAAVEPAPVSPGSTAPLRWYQSVVLTVTVFETDPTVAVMVTVWFGWGPAVARPFWVVSFTLTLFESVETQVADAVTACTVPLLKVPMASSWSDALRTRLIGPTGVIVREIRVTGVTVSPVDPLMSTPSDAEIVVEPSATVDAMPWDPAELLIVANEVLEESHVTVLVKSCVVPSV